MDVWIWTRVTEAIPAPQAAAPARPVSMMPGTPVEGSIVDHISGYKRVHIRLEIPDIPSTSFCLTQQLSTSLPADTSVYGVRMTTSHLNHRN
jgi:hypothetical protein